MSRWGFDVPDGWERIEYLCYPRNGSKAFKHPKTDETIHIVNMYDTGAYNVNAKSKDGEVFDDLLYDYFDAVATARGWMLRHGT